MSKYFSHVLFEKMPVVGILRNYTLEEIKFIAPIFRDAGLTTLEITMNSPEAMEEIKYLTENFPDLNIGAGTVCTMEDLERAQHAGASFIVSPIFDIKLIKASLKQNLGVFPGAFSPTEIFQAMEAGATAVKIFPATTFGSKYVKEILAPLSHLKLLPTGGISDQNIKDYFKAGAIGVGMGSSLFNKDCLKNRDKSGLNNGFQAIVRLVKEAVMG